MTDAFLALAALLAPQPSPTVPLKLPPVHECSDDRDFDRFRYELMQAVARRDKEALLAKFAPDVLLSFGGSRGRNDLLKEWGFDAAEYGNIWTQLETLLKLGCARSGAARIIPSLITQVEPFEDDGVGRVLLLPGATLYESRGVESPNSDTVSWTLATVTSRVADWGTGVRLPDGREGWIPDEELYDPIGYRLVIEKRGGSWRVTAFVAGD